MPALTITDLNNAKLDVDHIAEIATGLSSTATDRLGHTKNTIHRAMELIDADVLFIDGMRGDAITDINADVTAVDDRADQALSYDIPAAIASLSVINNRGAWVTATSYTYQDIVSESGNWYICVVPHTSTGVFATDALTKWRIHQGVTVGTLLVGSGAGLVGYDQDLLYPDGTIGKKLQEFPSVRDYGATGLGIADDGPAFTAAAADSEYVEVPPGEYLIKTPIVITQPVQFVGKSGPIPMSAIAGGPRIIYHTDLGASPMVDCEATAWFSGCVFKGPVKGTGTAIRTKKDLSAGLEYEDTDVTFFNCVFSDWNVGIDHWNRGLLLGYNNFALCTSAVKLSVDAVNWTDDTGNDFDLIDEGFRAIRITDNRFHGVTTCITNTGTDADKLRGLQVSGNQVDIGDVLFSGGCRHSLFVGNTVDHTSGTALEFTTDILDVTISGNVFRGDSVQVTNPFQLVVFNGDAASCSISGNTFYNVGAYAIAHIGSALNCTYSGNTFDEVGTAGDGTRSCIRFFDTVTNCSISGNTFNPRADAYCVRGSTGVNWTGVSITGNSWNRSRTLHGVYVDNGNNWFQPTSDKLEVNYGLMSLGGNNVGGFLLTVNDDSVGTVTPPRTGGFCILTANGDAGAPSNTNSTIFYYDCGLSLRGTKVITAEGTTVDISLTDVTGTTGTDGHTTVAVLADTIKVENRVGATVGYQLTFL